VIFFIGLVCDCVYTLESWGIKGLASWCAMCELTILWRKVSSHDEGLRKADWLWCVDWISEL